MLINIIINIIMCSDNSKSYQQVKKLNQYIEAKGMYC